MKSWVLIPLVLFITIAGYQFGYYRAKLEYSDADKQRMTAVMDNSARQSAEDDIAIFGPANLQAAELSPATLQQLPAPGASDRNTSTAPVVQPQSAADSVTVLEQAAMQERERSDAQKAFAENYHESDLDMEAATLITDFFQLHPYAPQLSLHSVRCSQEQCQLIGQYEGSEDSLRVMINELREQDWYHYAGTSSSTHSDGNTTHFVLHLENDRAS